MAKVKLSSYQKVFYNEWRINPNATHYNIVFDQVLAHNLDLSRLQSALTRFISEHFIFNSHIAAINDELYWIENSQIKQLEQLYSYTNQEIMDYIATPFNLEVGPLYRFTLFNQLDGNNRVILVLHNILIDKNSFGAFTSTISNYYNDITYKAELNLSEQIERINSVTEKLWNKIESNHDKNQQFWTNALSEVEVLDLRFMRNPSYHEFEPQQKTTSTSNDTTFVPGNLVANEEINSIKALNFSFDLDTITKLKVIEKTYKLNTYWYSQLIFAILLYKYTSQNKFAISYLTPIKECQNLIYALGINTNPIPYQIDGNTPILDVIGQITTSAQAINNEQAKYSYHPIDEIVNCSIRGILDVFFTETDFRESKFNFNNVDTICVNHEFEIDLPAKLVFEQELKDNIINFRVKYDVNKIDEIILNNFVRHYQRLFTSITNDLINGITNKTIRQYQILDDKEYQEIVYEWNKTDKEYPDDKTIHQLFEEQVIKTPNNIAVVYEDTKLTYQELNERSNQLAHYLRTKYQIHGDDLIALCLDRSEYILIAILAVLKSGGAYVPIDPSYPDARIKYVLEDTKAKVLLASNVHIDKLTNIVGTITPIDRLVNGTITDGNNYKDNIITELRFVDTIESQILFKQYPVTNPEQNITSKNLAYVIYTSGTTGVPKGVMQQHNNIVLLFNATADVYMFDSNDVWLLFHSYIFDFSVWEIYGALMYGGKLIIPNYVENIDLVLFCELCKKHGITVLNQTPHLFYQLIDVIKFNQKYTGLNTLRYIIFGGDILNLLRLQPWFNKYGDKHPRLVNMYGITETTVHVTYKIIMTNTVKVGGDIGNMLSDQKAYILDVNLQPLPIGAIGELYVGGARIARGYLNQPDLTKEKFIANPFQTETEKQQNKNGRLYKTGDLVRYLPDGNIEYIGRNDFQVKIRGYRVELSEIENILTSYTGIKQAVVVQRTEDGRQRTEGRGQKTELVNKYLVGYYVADSAMSQDVLLEYLSEHLPEYMIPNALVQLDKLPLTINGKLDRKALPVPDLTGMDKYVAPRNELEAKVRDICAEVLILSADKISVTSNFFKLGGNSILATKLVTQLNTEFHSAVKVSSLFTFNTIEQIANLVKHTINQFEYKEYLINATNTHDLHQPFMLSNVQQAYYFGRLPEFELGNISTHYYSETKFSNLDGLKLEVAINKLIQRHLGLRTVFINGQQQYLEAVPEYKVHYNEITDEKELLVIRNELSHKIYAPDQFPLFDFRVTKCKGYYVLHLSYDILLMDANSCQILLKELGVLYNNPSAQLPGLDITYRDYINKISQIRQSKLFTRAKEYWLNKLDDYNLEMNLPLQSHPSEVKNPRFNRISKTIPRNIWQKIENKSRLHGIGLTSLVLTLYAKVLSYWTNQTSLCINLTLFNRLPLHKDINDVIGDFTVLELFSYKDEEQNILTKFHNTHQELWNDIEHNLFDGIDFQRLIHKERNIPSNQVLCPAVLTSILGSKLGFGENLVNDSYLGIEYSITQTSQVWLDNKAYETRDGFIAEWDYVEQLFDLTTITAMHQHYCDLIEYIATADWRNSVFPALTLPVADLRLIEAANSATQPIVAETLFSYYENYVTTNQLLNNIAVIECADAVHQYSYAQVLKDTQLLAKYLCYSGSNTKNNQLIAILSENGYNQVLATVAIIKSGSGYLPLNVYWPVGRLDEVLTQGQVNTILISRREANREEIKENLANKYKFLIIEDIIEEIHKNTNIYNKLDKISLPRVNPDNIAYVIFTSGSTGVPKGVTISHRGALNTIIAVNQRYKLTEKDKILAISDLSFDLSVYDIFGLLAVGGTVVFPNQDKTKEIMHWLELVYTHGITIWNSVPQLASLLVDGNSSSNSKNYLHSLRLFLLSGDWIPLDLPNNIKNCCDNPTVVGLGGATEGSIWSIWYEIEQINPKLQSVPYGISMPNQKMYILNHNLEHCPVGVIGEIYIGGVGIALSYWNATDKTTASFINHSDLDRLYKTGDLGKWCQDGHIEFIGRNDDQVKINGYRVELGEIAAKLNKVPGISKAIVTIQCEDNQSYIIAYLLLQNDSPFCDLLFNKNLELLKKLKEYIEKYISNQLPDYMLPYSYKILDHVPLTANGKLAVNQLSKFDIHVIDNICNHTENKIEIKICELYADILGIETTKIQRQSNFFRLGGNSVLAMKLLLLLNQQLKVDLKFFDIFTATTVSAMADRINGFMTK